MTLKVWFKANLINTRYQLALYFNVPFRNGISVKIIEILLESNLHYLYNFNKKHV